MPPPETPGFFRFKVGSLTVTTVHDGHARRPIEGLVLNASADEVRSVLEADPVSGHVFLFLNRRRTQVKLLLWTRGGFTVVHNQIGDCASAPRERASGAQA